MLKRKGNCLAFSAKYFKKKWLKESTELIVFFSKPTLTSFKFLIILGALGSSNY